MKSSFVMCTCAQKYRWQGNATWRESLSSCVLKFPRLESLFSVGKKGCCKNKSIRKINLKIILIDINRYYCQVLHLLLTMKLYTLAVYFI